MTTGLSKKEIAGVLNSIGTLLELKGENPFKVRAYQAGAWAVEALEEDLGGVIAEGRLSDIKGIGAALTQKITELHETGRLRFYDELRASVAPGLIELLEIPGLGAKKIIALNKGLGVDGVAALARACADGLVAALPGFGERTQEKLVEGIRNREAYARRHLWWDAQAVAEPIVAGLRGVRGVRRAEAAGSLRRGLETVGDLDFLVAVDAGDEGAAGRVVEWFTSRAGVSEVTARGGTKASVRHEGGLQADLRVVPVEQFAFALHHFTGSKEHNVLMRQRALARGLSLSEWGLEETGAGGEKAGGEKKTKAETKITSEAGLFAALGLAFIEPELREGLGEIEAAEWGGEGNGESATGGAGILPAGSRRSQALARHSLAPSLSMLPRLVGLGDLRGAFHNHTAASDGNNSLEEMVAGAQALGWEYIGISDHSKASFQAHGLDEARLAGQVAQIKGLNASGKFTTRVFAGTECDILPDGALDFDDATLAGLDFVVASVHNAFAQEEERMTARIIRALENPRVTMLGHLTGRLLLRREGYRVNAAKVIDAAIANGVVIELNATPSRLDMDWRLWRRAAGRGLLCSINPDAHDVAHLAYVRAGVNAARKGWLAKENVINTKPLAAMRRWLEARRGAGARAGAGAGVRK